MGAALGARYDVVDLFGVVVPASVADVVVLGEGEALELLPVARESAVGVGVPGHLLERDVVLAHDGLGAALRTPCVEAVDVVVASEEDIAVGASW